MERQNPETSHEAFAAVSETMLTNHWNKILNAISVLKLATYEEISTFCGFSDKNMTSRRLLELMKEGLIYKPGTKKLTSSGRNAYQYALTGSETVLPTTPEKYTKQTVSAADYASKIIAGTSKGILEQQKLFDND